MKKITLVICQLFFVIIILSAQSVSDTIWTKAIGGSGTEVPGLSILNSQALAGAFISRSNDGFYYVATSTNSNNGYVSSNAGSNDVLLIKMTLNGDTVWTKVFGGSGDDRVYRVRAINNNGCVLVGRTNSNDGFFTGNHGMMDAFMIKVNSNGSVAWKKLYGGSQDDILYDFVENAAGNYMVVGESLSSNGDLAGTGAGLAWVIFVNTSNGSYAWSNTYNGPDASSPDFLNNFTCVTRLSDGSGYLASGFTTPDFNNSSADNIWVMKFSFNGTVIWNKKYGAATGADYSATLIDAGNGEFYIVGSTQGTGGDSPGFYGGNADAWLIRCNANGNIVWSKNYGGSNWEFFNDAVRDANGNLYLGGFTRSVNNDLAALAPFGTNVSDYWLVKTDAQGNILKQYRAGGPANDFGIGIALEPGTGNILMSGRTESTNGYVHGNNGGRDLWIVHFNLNPDTLPTDTGTVDVALIDAISPQSIVTYTTGSNVPVICTIKNNGSDTISNFEIWYRVNNGPLNNETVSSSIAPNQTSDFSFTNFWFAANAGSYTMEIRIPALTDETDTTNNALFISFEVQDETQPVIDVKVGNIISPSASGSYYANVPIDIAVEIINEGTVNLSNFAISYNVNNSGWVNDIFNATLNGGDMSLFIFSAPWQPTGTGEFCMEIKIEPLAGESNITNNSNNACFSVQQPVAIENLTTAFHIYPNPTTDYIVLPQQHDYTVELYNALSQVVYSGDHTHCTIDVRALPGDTYYLRMINDQQNTSTVHKILILR